MKARPRPLYQARYYRWQPNPPARRERTIRVKRVRFRTPRQFVQDCLAVVPELPFQCLSVIGNRTSVPHLSINYGATARGVQYHLDVTVPWTEAEQIEGYLRQTYRTHSLWTTVEKTAQKGGA